MTEAIAVAVLVLCSLYLAWVWWFFLWMTWGSEFCRRFPYPFFWQTRNQERRKP